MVPSLFSPLQKGSSRRVISSSPYIIHLLIGLEHVSIESRDISMNTASARASGIFRHSSYTHCQPMKQPSYFFPTPLLFYLHFPSYVLAYINTPGHSLGGEFSTLWSFAKVMVKALENLSTLWPRLWNFPDFGKLQKASPRMWIHLGGHCAVLSLPMEDETMQDHGARHCSIGVHYRAIEPAISRYRPIHGAFFFTSWCIICSWAPIFIHIIRLISRILHNLEPFHSFPL